MVWSDRDFVHGVAHARCPQQADHVPRDPPQRDPGDVLLRLPLVAALIIVEAALAFFGVGDVSGVSWGVMIQNGRSQLERAPHMVLFPALFMFLTILALNFIGDSVRTRFDVREAGI